MPKSGVPADEREAGLMDRRFGALALARMRLSPKRSMKPTAVGDGVCDGSGVREPRSRRLVSVSMRDRADDCCSWRSLLRPVSYRRRVLVVLRSTGGVDVAVIEAPDAACQSLIDEEGC